MDTQNSTGVEIKETGNKGNLNLWRRISGVLWGGPRKTFEDIVARPGVVAMAALLLFLNFILVLPQIPKLKEYSLWLIQNNPATSEMAAQQISVGVTATVVAIVVGLVLGPLIMWLIMAGLLKLFNAFTGEKASFGTLFAVAVYAYLPLMLAMIIRSILYMNSPAQDYHKISTGLTLLFPGVEGKLYNIIAQIDPFSIWGLVLLAVGSSVAMRLPTAKTGAYIGVLWIICVLAIGLLAHGAPAAGM